MYRNEHEDMIRLSPRSASALPTLSLGSPLVWLVRVVAAVVRIVALLATLPIKHSARSRERVSGTVRNATNMTSPAYLVAHDVFEVPPRTRGAPGAAKTRRVGSGEVASSPCPSVKVRVPTVARWGRTEVPD